MADVEAICEAVTRPNLRLVSTKTLESAKRADALSPPSADASADLRETRSVRILFPLAFASNLKPFVADQNNSLSQKTQNLIDWHRYLFQIKRYNVPGDNTVRCAGNWTSSVNNTNPSRIFQSTFHASAHMPRSARHAVDASQIGKKRTLQ
jgi:hypothetical protein